MEKLLWFLLLAIGAAIVVWVPGWGILSRWRTWRRHRYRRQLEDALKHLLTLSQRNQSGSAESLTGALKLSQRGLVALIARMEARGLIHSTSGGLELTPAGERWALQIVRAHRLWERYLADEAGMPLTAVHGAAERAEHDLTAENLDELEARLGHPLMDPHGDPIPQADGSLEKLDAVPLTDWSTDTKAYVAHVEDEPEVVFRQIAALGVQRGDPIRVLERGPDHLTVAHGDGEHRLAPVVAANIHVRLAPLEPARPADSISLADLPDSAEAEVVAIDSHFRGFARRRLLDLGLTPHTRVVPALENAFGDPRAYRVRGTTIALRNDQARFVWVRPASSAAAASQEGITA